MVEDEGLFVDSDVFRGDPEALAACLAQMAGDPEASQRMGQAGRERVEKAFTVEAAAAGIRAGVMRVIGRSPATGDL